MASSPITSWQIDGETVTDFIFGDSKITADCDCSHEIKRHLLLGRKAMSNLDSILKSRDITLPAKVHLVKAMVFPVVMDRCESWTIKKAERRRINAFKLVLEKTLESPLDYKEIQPVLPKGNQSWVFIGRTDVEAETPKLWPPDAKNQLTHLKRPWCWERLRLGGEGNDRGWGGWMASPTGMPSHGIHEFGWTLGVADGQGNLACCRPWGHKELGMTERLNWISVSQVAF